MQTLKHPSDWEEDATTVVINDEFGTMFLFKPYPPFDFFVGNRMYFFDDIGCAKPHSVEHQRLIRAINKRRLTNQQG
jgi:hypothetical protein